MADTLKIPQSVLIDARNWEANKASLLVEIQNIDRVAFDIETQDSGRHEGLNAFMGVDPKTGKKKANKPLVFDIKRTVVTGFSWYCRGSDHAYYLNLNHADVENRIPWDEAKVIIEALKTKPVNVIHNASFERTMMKECYGVDLGTNVLCSMQLAVTAFNEDTYDIQKFKDRDLGNIKNLFPAVRKAFQHYVPGKSLDSVQEELLFKFIAKESTASHSYNGWVLEMAYRFGLKSLSKNLLGYEQQTFEATLNGKAHMGELTGEEVVSYGADDAWVCMAVADRVMQYIKERSPKVLPTFINQENPMTQIYSDVWSQGLRIDIEAVKKAQIMEREKAAAILRVMKKGVRALITQKWGTLDMSLTPPHEKLYKYDKWFENNWEKYREKIVSWAFSEDSDDAFEQLHQVSSAISNAWAEEKGVKRSKGVNLNHYMPVRVLLYDLCGFSYIQAEGKTQSNGDAQQKMRERWIKKYGEVKGDAALLILSCLEALSSSEQIMKLYVTNYLHLTDPDTGKMYPVLNSLLNTRRMALSFPNVSQLPKFGYVRTFFQADNDDHLVVSCDWSGIELVIIGELSKDEEFYKAYGQLPYADLHTKAAAGTMEISIEELKALPNYKELRRDLGKGSNFGYWYSGGLGTVAQTMGWSSDEHWEKVDGYRNTFKKAEAWRVGEIRKVKGTGEVELLDHHKRYRFEATKLWASLMRAKFAEHGPEIAMFGNLAIKKIQTRAGNQAVNAEVQGTGGTLAKRSILRMKKVIQDKGYDARFMFPVHDELLYSVHKKDLLAFIKDLKIIMCTHPDLFPTLKLDATVAIGRNFGAYDPEKNPYGQIELDEFNADIEGVEKEYQKLGDADIIKVVNYLTNGA